MALNKEGEGPLSGQSGEITIRRESSNPFVGRRITVIYARHGEAENSAYPDSPLTERGKKQARDFALELGRRLEQEGKTCIIKIGHNGFTRAEETSIEIEKTLESPGFPHVKVRKPRKKEEFRAGADSYGNYLARRPDHIDPAKVGRDHTIKLLTMLEWKNADSGKIAQIIQLYGRALNDTGRLLDRINEDGANYVYLTIISEPDLAVILDRLRQIYRTEEPIFSNIDKPFAGIDYLAYIEADIHKGEENVRVSHGEEVFNAKRSTGRRT